MTTAAGGLVSTHSQGLRPLRELYLELGLALSRHDRIAEAIQAFEQALKEEGATPGGDVVLFNLGQTHEHAGKLDLALHSYLEAVAVAPQRLAEILPSAQAVLTRDLAVKEDEWLESQWVPNIKTADLAPGSRAELARFLGRVSLYRGDYARGEEMFREAQQLTPEDPRVLEGLGEVLWHTGKIPEALQLLTRAHDIVEKGDHKERLTAIDAKLAQALVAAGLYQAALEVIANSLAAGDQFTNELLLSRSQCYLALAEWEKALDAAQAAQEKTPASTEARILSSQALIALGRCSDAAKVVDDGLQYDLQNPDLVLYKAEALLEDQIDVGQGRRLLVLYKERAGSAAVTPETLPPALVARSADGNAQYFVAELYRALGRYDDALKAVERALEIGLSGKAEYREAPAQQLKAELLEKRGDLQQAANFYYEAGRRFLWRNECNDAVAQLARSAELDKTRLATYWYRAEALRVLTYQASLSPEEKKRTIQESVDIWDKSTDFGCPDRDTSWAYVVRGLICERRANLQATKVSELRGWTWESAAFAERGLVLDNADAFSWAYLGRYHRSLGNQANSLQATQKAWDLDKENLTVQEERAAILANVGEFAAAGETIDKRRAAAKDPWADGVKAYILAAQRQYKEALDLIAEAEPDVWTLDLRARCRRMMGEQKAAKDDYKAVLSQYNAENPGDQVLFGVAAYYLNEIDRAIQILSDYLATDDDIGGYWYLGACHLSRNSLQEAEKNLAKGVAVTINTRELDDLLAVELPTLETTSKGWSHQAQVVGIFQRIRDQIMARRDVVRHPLSPEKELKQAINAPARADVPGGDGWRWIAIQAGLGRMYAEGKQYDDAAAAYGELSKLHDKFPEAGIALVRIAAGFEAEGDRILKDADATSAMRQYQSGLDILSDDTAKAIADQASLRGRLGLAYFLSSDAGKARSEFRLALELARKLGTEHPGRALGETCWQLITSPQQYWALDDEFNSWAREVRDEETLTSDLAGAREALAEFLVNWLEKPAEDSSESRIPVVTPVVMEIGSGLIAEDTGKNWTLWKFILEMRERCEKQMGVTVPGVRVRGNDALDHNDYTLLLGEDWVAAGSTQLKMRFCPAAPDVLQGLGIPSEAVVTVANPLTGQPGCWTAPEYWQLIATHNIELWEEPLVFVVHHLETVLRQNLAEFLGIQEVENMLKSWSTNEADSVFIQHALPDETSRVRFARLLRTLVSEQVPITSWKEILVSVQGPGLANLASAVRAVRVQLKKELPGNAIGTRHCELPAEWAAIVESWLTCSDGITIFAPPGEQLHRFLLMLADLLESNETQVALVVGNPDIRPYLRRLVEWRFPHLTVLSQDEVVVQAASGSPAG